MGTYSNLVPSGVCNSIYFEEDPPWQAYEETSGTFTTSYEVSTDTNYGTARYTAEFRFDLPASVNVSYVTITANVYPSFNAQGTLYASITNYNGGSGGTSTSAQSASVTGIDAQRTFSFSGISFGNTNSFYVKFWSDNLVGGSPTRYESVGVGVIRANVLYTDPPQPRVTIGGPSGLTFSDGQSFQYTWTVSNGTQTQAVVQESTDNSSWSNVGTVSGSGTSLSGTARYTASSGAQQVFWRVVVTFSGGTTVTSSSASYSIQEPYVPPEPDYPPSVSNISTTPVQPSGLPATFSSVYIANVSKCKVQASISAGTNAIREVYFSYPGVEKVSMTYDSTARKYVGTTPLALSSSVSITVTAVDTSGYWTASDPIKVSVAVYADPTLTVNTLYRCDALGAEDNTGQYYKIQVTATCSSVQNKNSITSLTAGVKNGQTTHNLTNGQFHTFGPELPNEDLVYVIHISVTDYVGHETWIERSLAGRLRDVVFKRDVQHETAHVGVGMTPDWNARTTVQLPPNGTIIIGGQDLISWLQNTLGESFPGWDS